jgi:inositol phosphorylceramide mannosyltransferase catalytic subunit
MSRFYNRMLRGHRRMYLICTVFLVLRRCIADEDVTDASRCDSGLLSSRRLTHNRLLFTVPIATPLDEDTKFIHFCSDDTIKTVANLFCKYYYPEISTCVNRVEQTLWPRKLKYDHGQRHLKLVWKKWNKENHSLSLPAVGNIPKILHFVWLGEASLPKYAIKNIAAWKELHPQFTVRIWDERSLATDLPMHNAAYASTLTDPRAKSDIVRIEALYRFGGVYLDVDVKPIRNISPLLDWDAGEKCFAVLESTDVVNNAVLGASPGNTFFRRLLRDFEAWGVVHHGREAWEVTGPKYLTHAVKTFPGQMKIYPSSLFNPIHFSLLQANETVHSCKSGNTTAYGFHQWNSRRTLLPTKLSFLSISNPTEASIAQIALTVKLRIEPWRGPKIGKDEFWSFCVQLQRFPAKERCSKFSPLVDKRQHATLNISGFQSGNNVVRIWLLDSVGVPHAGSSVTADKFLVRGDLCTAESKMPYWCSHPPTKHDIKLDSTSLESGWFHFHPTLGPLQSALAFSASLPSGLSYEFQRQLATLMHLKLSPEKHNELQNTVDKGTLLLDRGKLTEGKMLFLEVLSVIGSTPDSVAPHLYAAALNGMITYARIVGDERMFLQYLERTFDIFEEYPPALINYGIYLYRKAHYDQAAAIMERVYELGAKEGTEGNKMIESNLFKTYTWSCTDIDEGLTRAISFGAKLLDLPKSSLFVLVTLSQFELQLSSVYDLIHQKTCQIGLFCLNDTASTIEPVGVRLRTIVERLQSPSNYPRAAALSVVYVRMKKSWDWIHEAFDPLIKSHEEQLDMGVGKQIVMKEPIVLVIEYFVSSATERADELHAVMWLNLHNEFITNVCILTEDDGTFATLLGVMKTKCDGNDQCFKRIMLKMNNAVIGGRATFKRAIEYGQHNLSRGFMIIANADIYFDHTLKFIAYSNRSLAQGGARLRCYALLRWECIHGKPGPNSMKYMAVRTDSQDAWILPLPFDHFDPVHLNFYFGKNGADNVFIQRLRDGNVLVTSPSLLIRSYHLHRVKRARTYGHDDAVKVGANPSNSSQYVLLSHMLAP